MILQVLHTLLSIEHGEHRETTKKERRRKEGGKKKGGGLRWLGIRDRIGGSISRDQGGSKQILFTV